VGVNVGLGVLVGVGISVGEPMPTTGATRDEANIRGATEQAKMLIMIKIDITIAIGTPRRFLLMISKLAISFRQLSNNSNPRCIVQ